MDDFPGLLERDFGFKPQGKSAPMAPSRNQSSNYPSSPNYDFTRSPPSARNKSNSSPVFDDHDQGDDGLMFNDVFGAPPRYTFESRAQPQSAASFDYDSIFKGQSASKAASGPVFDKPVYDDEDIFEGVPGIKTSSTTSASSRFDNVFASSSPTSRKPESSAFDDLLGNFGKKETTVPKTKERASEEKRDTAAFDDLIPGFGNSSSPPRARSTSETESRKSSSSTTKTASYDMDDPFGVLGKTSRPPLNSSGVFSDPLDEFSKFGSSGSIKADHSSVHGGVFDGLDPLENLGKSAPEINKREQDRSHMRTGGRNGAQSPSDNYESHLHKKVHIDDFLESHQAQFNMPSTSVRQTTSPSYVDTSPNNTNTQFIPKSVPEDNFESPDDVWLTVSEIPLFTQPTSAPPPSRPPPPRPTRHSTSQASSFNSANARRKVNAYASSNSTPYSYSPNLGHASVRSSVPSQIDDLDDFAMGRTRNNFNEVPEGFSAEDSDTNSVAAASAAAMKDAMDKAEAKFRHAKEKREREHLKPRSREGVQLPRDDSQEETIDKQERFDRERQQRQREEEEQRRIEREERARELEREREEKEREQKRLEKERIERERELARQAVERATREARERAAAEARAKAQRAAVGKASAEARERAEKAAVQRVQAEARERAAAEAKGRAERAAAEVKERANADARHKAERAAVDRAASEARERAAAMARDRAAAQAAQARANQQNNDNDLESFFGGGSRPSSAPRPRTNSSDPMFDTQNKGGPTDASRTSAAASANMRKASSSTNIVDDLSSIFGAAASSSGAFQEVDGETEERRRARLERHQRTQERAKKALAEKNERDLQAQREQSERHRFAETLDAEIKRWAAGKEGNLRALLSTMHYVLWPECGWQPVSLTDLMTAASVKKVYRKATLCIHPDKVQQKGATLQQKYVAEKVFDLLKEAWNKFNSEELF